MTNNDIMEMKAIINDCNELLKTMESYKEYWDSEDRKLYNQTLMVREMANKSIELNK